MTAVVPEPRGVDDAQPRKANQHNWELEDDCEERKQDQDEIDRVGDAEGRGRNGIGYPDERSDDARQHNEMRERKTRLPRAAATE